MTTKSNELDAWGCPECFGHGKFEVYKKVSHLLGSDMLPFIEECEACEGVGFFGPDAQKMALARMNTAQPAIKT